MVMKTKTGKVLLAVAVVLVFGVAVLSLYRMQRRDTEVRIETFAAKDVNDLTESEELQLISQWIQRAQLNPYGDSLDTVYALGNPLVDEQGKEARTLLQYVRERHPDEPWKH